MIYSSDTYTTGLVKKTGLRNLYDYKILLKVKCCHSDNDLKELELINAPFIPGREGVGWWY